MLKPFQPQYRNILPLTFDDSLTYYEQMLNLYNVVNKCYEDVEEIKKDVEEIVGKIVDEKTATIIQNCNSYTDNKIENVQNELKELAFQLDNFNKKISDQYIKITGETDRKIERLQTNINNVSESVMILSSIVKDILETQSETYTKMYMKLVNAINDYMNELSLNVYCWNPVDKNYTTFEKALNDVYDYSRYGSYTAKEYSERHLTAEEYDKKKISAKKYATNIKHFWFTDKFLKLFSGFTGKLGREYLPIQSLTDWVKPYPLTCEKYDNKKITAKNYDDYDITAYNYDFNGKYETEGLKNYKRIDSVRDIPMVQNIDLENRVTTLENDLNPNVENSVANKVDNLETTTSTLNHEFTVLSGVVESHTRYISQLDNTLTTVESNITELQSDMTENDRQIKSAKDDIITLQGDMTNAKEDIEGMKEVNKKLTEQIQALTSKSNEIDTSIADINNTLTQHTADITVINENDKKLDSRVKAVEDIIPGLQNSITSLENKDKSLDSDIIAIQTDIGDIRTDYDSVNNKIGTITDLTTNDKSSIVKAINELNEKITTLETENANIKKEITAIKTANLKCVEGGNIKLNV